MGRWANPGLLATLASKLGFAHTETRVDGQVQVRLHTGYGLKIRERRVIPPAAAESAPNGSRDALRVNGSNGYARKTVVTNGATEHNGSSKRTYLAVLEEDGPLDALELAGLEFAGEVFDGREWRHSESGEPVSVAQGLSALSSAASSRERASRESVESGSPGILPGIPHDASPEALDAPDAQSIDSADVLNPPASEELPAPAPNRHAILSGKVIGVVGFSEEQAVSLGQALAAQHCSFVVLSHAEAEFKKGAASACHLLLVSASKDWSNPASLKVSWLGKLKKPAIVESDRTTLSFLAKFPQAGSREFVPGPCPIDELLWRSALILGRMPTVKARKNRKRQHPVLVIADSDPASLTLVETVLTQEGVECRVADNGSLALELIKATTPDAVILEVTLPGADGFQLLAEIRRDPALAGMVVILLTSRQAEADVLRGFSLGADDYVTKPFSPLELAARLKRALSRVA
ncbi:MAG TPA: response regulator [Bryobacteraceae bacterium]|nr:response regulator [Bryobacteraceae bacterium]